MNGLQSLIPTLLLFSVLGYSFVLPDMIGGNEYVRGEASHELYIRWAQVNVFMPAWQFSVSSYSLMRMQAITGLEPSVFPFAGPAMGSGPYWSGMRFFLGSVG